MNQDHSKLFAECDATLAGAVITLVDARIALGDREPDVDGLISKAMKSLSSLRAALSGRGEAVPYAWVYRNPNERTEFSAAPRHVTYIPIDALDPENKFERVTTLYELTSIAVSDAPPSPQQGTREAVAWASPATLTDLKRRGELHNDGSQSADMYAGQWGSNLVPLYSHPPASPPSVPEPTQEMIFAGVEKCTVLWQEPMGVLVAGVYRAMRGSAPQPPPAAGQWMGIESAPMDGTEILISGFAQGGKEGERFIGLAIYSARNEVWTWRDSMDGEGFHPPTHWQPAPLPPAHSQQGEAK